jgi:hypothetical protein
MQRQDSALLYTPCWWPVWPRCRPSNGKRDPRPARKWGNNLLQPKTSLQVRNFGYKLTGGES